MPDYPQPPDHTAIRSFNAEHDRKAFQKNVDALVEFFVKNPDRAKLIVRQLVNAYLTDKDGDL
jgi:hypothetical protein